MFPLLTLIPPRIIIRNGNSSIKEVMVSILDNEKDKIENLKTKEAFNNS